MVRVLCSFYTATEITAAKKCLIGLFQDVLVDTVFLTERRTSTVRSAHDAELEDVLGIFDLLDKKEVLQTVTFVAFDLSRLPGYGPEETNICSVVDKQVQLSAQCSSLADMKSEVTNTVLQGFDCLQAKITDLASICSQLVNTANIVHSDTGAVAPTRTATVMSGSLTSSTATVDRSKNVVVFGVEDCRDRNTWHDTVLQALRSAAGREVMIEDAFRIGRPTPGKNRPVLVKLRSVWDKRTVVSGSWKLYSTVGFERVFIAPDEPLDARRRRTLDRLKKKATDQGKHVAVTDGVLYVDSVKVFSLQQGFSQQRDD